MIKQSCLDTTWNVDRDVQKIVEIIEGSSTNKNQLKVVFIGEQHHLKFDQERRRKLLGQLRSSRQFFYVIVERGLNAAVDGVPNVIWENSRMDASFLQRNQNTINQIEDDWKSCNSNTIPMLVFLFGERHEKNTGSDSTKAIQHLLLEQVKEWRRDKVALLQGIGEIVWTSVPSIDTVISGEPINANWDKLVKIESNSLLGCVEYNANEIDHNMLLAEKCMIKQMFQVDIAPESEMFGGSYWKLYIKRTKSSECLFKYINQDGDRSFKITSLNPSHMLKAVFHGPR